MAWKNYDVRDKFIGAIKDAIVNGKLEAGRSYKYKNVVAGGHVEEPSCSMGHGYTALGCLTADNYGKLWNGADLRLHDLSPKANPGDSKEKWVSGLTAYERYDIEESNDGLFRGRNLMTKDPSRLTAHIQLLEKIPVEDE